MVIHMQLAPSRKRNEISFAVPSHLVSNSQPHAIQQGTFDEDVLIFKVPYLSFWLQRSVLTQSGDIYQVKYTPTRLGSPQSIAPPTHT